MAHIAALVRLAHPLPTLLNALVAAALTTTAGGSTSEAALAAITMLGVHTSIGAMNDLLDQAGDAGRAEKPLVGGNVSPREARAQVTRAPKQLLVLKPGLDVVHGTWVVAIMNKGQAPAKFRTPVLMPLEARDFQPIEGVTADEVKFENDGLWVEKEFPVGVNVVSFAFIVPSSLGGSLLSLKPRADTGELMIMTPKGMLDVSGKGFVESGTDVEEMQRYAVLSSNHLIVAGEELSLRVDGIPEGRGRLWLVGSVFGLLLVLIAGVLAWRSRPRSSVVAV